VISEGSCDTEDWSNDTEHSALITGINDILSYSRTENIYFITFHIITVFTVFLIKSMQLWWAEETKESHRPQTFDRGLEGVYVVDKVLMCHTGFGCSLTQGKTPRKIQCLDGSFYRTKSALSGKTDIRGHESSD